MTKYNVQFEVLDGTEPEALHEDLCQVLHEGVVATVPYTDVGFPDQIPIPIVNKPTVYIQDADGNERTLPVTEPDPADGTYCAHMDDEGRAWIRIVPGTEEVPTVYYTRVPITEWDNRDSGETWLWYDKIHYIAVSPFEMIKNMVDNCKPWIIEEEGVTESELETALLVLARACGQA